LKDFEFYTGEFAKIIHDNIVIDIFPFPSSSMTLLNPQSWNSQQKLGLFPKCVLPKFQPIDPKFLKPHVDVFFQLT
jgi:hypothetical protein